MTRSEYYRQWKAANIEHVREYAKMRARKKRIDPEYRARVNARTKAWREKNRERLLADRRMKYAENPEPARERTRIWRKANREHIRSYTSKYAPSYRKKNRVKLEEARRAWRSANAQRCRDQAAGYIKQRRATDINFKIRSRLSSRLRCALHSNSKSGRAVELLGCSIDDFKIYLESKFEVGMNWENYGTWHIDHIMPCAIFDLTKPEHQRRCFHFSNLQPLFAADNRLKSAKVTSNQFNLI